MFRRAIVVVVLLGLLPAGAAFAQNQAVGSANVGALVDDGIALAKTADLAFGTIVPSAAAGTVTVSTADVRTSGGGVSLYPSTAAAAVFSVTKLGPGSKKFTVLLPASATLVNSSDASKTITLDTLTHNAATTNPYSAVPYTLRVGGTLQIGANQAPGQYSGVFNVTVVQN